MALRARLVVSKLAGSMFDFSTKAHRKEAWLFLDTVWQGLEYLNEQVERAEKERAKSLGLNFAYCDFGNHPDDAMICNYFIWYANALCNFIGVFKKAFRKDLKKKFRAVITWRNKVAAHTSWVWPRGDSADMQDMSILLFPEFNFRFDGHFEVGGGRFISEHGYSRTQRLFVRVKNFLRKLLRIKVPKEPDWQWGLVPTHKRLTEIVSKYAPAKGRTLEPD